jgi:hypothetical protein
MYQAILLFLSVSLSQSLIAAPAGQLGPAYQSLDKKISTYTCSQKVSLTIATLATYTFSVELWGIPIFRLLNATRHGEAWPACTELIKGAPLRIGVVTGFLLLYWTLPTCLDTAAF